MEVLASVIALAALVVFVQVVWTVERFYSAMDDFDAQAEREAELLRKTRAEIEA